MTSLAVSKLQLGRKDRVLHSSIISSRVIDRLRWWFKVLLLGVIACMPS